MQCEKKRLSTNIFIAVIAVSIAISSTPVASAGLIFNIDWGGRASRARAIRIQHRYGHGVAAARSNSMYETTTFQSIPVEVRSVEALPSVGMSIIESSRVAVVEEAGKTEASKQQDKVGQPVKKEDDPVASKVPSEKQSEKSSGKPDDPNCVGNSCKAPSQSLSSRAVQSRSAVVSSPVESLDVYSGPIVSTHYSESYGCERCTSRSVARTLVPVGDGSGRIFSGRIRNAIRHSRLTPFR